MCLDENDQLLVSKKRTKFLDVLKWGQKLVTLITLLILTVALIYYGSRLTNEKTHTSYLPRAPQQIADITWLKKNYYCPDNEVIVTFTSAYSNAGFYSDCINLCRNTVDCGVVLVKEGTRYCDDLQQCLLQKGPVCKRPKKKEFEYRREGAYFTGYFQ